MLQKKWTISPLPPNDFIEAHPELPPVVLRLLWNRNIKTQAEIDEFLNPDYSANVHDPFLFKDMAKAVKIIFDAIANDEKIIVHGDYDADGVCAATILISTLKKLGANNVEAFLPHRETDGYGLNLKTVDLLHSQKTNLIITCDCGVSNFAEVTRAKELGIKVIITDHHTTPTTLPPADAILHPLVPGETYPDKTLSGGGVAFKLAQGLLRHHEKKSIAGVGAENFLPLPSGETHEGFEKWLLDLVAISTVADMVLLRGESRTLTRYGLTVLNKTKNIGLKKLLIAAGLAGADGKTKRGAYTTEVISFQIAPRINAAGRMDHANVALKLLMAKTSEEAQKLALQLNKNNSDRQKLTEKLVMEARYQIVNQKQEDNKIIFVYGETWSPGILGLVSGKIKDEFNKPTLALTKNQGEIMGSGRSVPGFNLIKTLQSLPQFFSKFGGHPMACGFSLKNESLLNNFKTAMLAKANTDLTNVDLTPQLNIDAEVNLDEVNWKLYDLLQKFEPFGVGNPEPLYAAYNLTVKTVDPVGKDEKHLRILVKHNSELVKKTIAFGFGDPARHPSDWKVNLKPGDKIDLAFTVGVNEWNGNRELQLQVEDIKRNK